MVAGIAYAGRRLLPFTAKNGRGGRWLPCTAEGPCMAAGGWVLAFGSLADCLKDAYDMYAITVWNN